MMSVEFGMSNQYSRNLSVDVKRRNSTVLENGRLPGRAPFGYKNDVGQKTVSIDESVAPYIRQAYDMYATGMYSYQQISDELYNQGLRTKANKKVYKSAIERWLKEPFYHGIIRRGGKHYVGNHQAIITKSKYDQVQEVLNRTGKPRRKSHDHAFLGLFKCAKCDCAITAQKQSGYTYYHCTEGKGDCPNIPVKKY